VIFSILCCVVSIVCAGVSILSWRRTVLNLNKILELQRKFPELGPYRTAPDLPPAPLKPEEQKPKPLILPYSDPWQPKCPRCGDSWIWNKSHAPNVQYCECNRCPTGHYHQTCSHVDAQTGKRNGGCGAKWIIKAKS